MRRYDDAVEVRRGRLPGTDLEGPEQFLWRGRLWKVRAVVAHWVETGAWWSPSPDAQHDAQHDGGHDGGHDGEHDGGHDRRPVAVGDLLGERELWRVEAGRGRPGPGDADDLDRTGITGITAITGVFDLSFDWSDGRWQLVGCVD